MGVHLVVRVRSEAPLLRDAGEDQLGFHHRELFADAGALAGAEREVRALGDRLAPFCVEAVGVEARGFREPAGVAVRVVDPDDDIGADGNGEAADFGWFHGLARDGVRGRVEAHGLLEDLLGVPEGRKIVPARCVTECTGFFADPLGDLRVLAEQVECPAQRMRGGLVSRDEEREQFVAQFLPREPVFLRPRGNERRQEIARVLGIGGACADRGGGALSGEEPGTVGFVWLSLVLGAAGALLGAGGSGISLRRVLKVWAAARRARRRAPPPLDRPPGAGRPSRRASPATRVSATRIWAAI